MKTRKYTRYEREWVMRVRNWGRHWLVRSQQLQGPFPFPRTIPEQDIQISLSAWSARPRAILIVSQCIGIHFKGVQSGWKVRSVRWGPAESARSSSTVEGGGTLWAEGNKGEFEDEMVEGCGIVEQRRFTMMVALLVKANVALPSNLPAATRIPWPFSYSFPPKQNMLILSVRETWTFDVWRSQRIASLSAVLPVSPIPILIVDSSRSFRQPWDVLRHVLGYYTKACVG